MNTRPKGPRRIVADALRALRKDLDAAAAPWTGSFAARIFDESFPHGGKWRKRTPAEMPENSTDAWRRLLTYAIVIQRQAAQLAEAATTQIIELERIAQKGGE